MSLIFFTNALLVDPDSGHEGGGSVVVQDGLIRDTGAHLHKAPEGAQIIDCGGHVLCPGLTDMRAFLGEPGTEHRETLASAGKAAAAGGVTTVICSPDTDPAIDNPAIVSFIRQRARETSCVNILPAAALTKGLKGQEMTEIGLLQEAGAVAFTDGARSISSARVMKKIMTYGRDLDALIMHHTEDMDLKGSAVMNAGEYASRLGLSACGSDSEAIMLERDLRLVHSTRARYHAALVTCRDSIELIRRARQDGLDVTAATSINHLTFNETDVASYRTFFKLTPPLRTEDDRLALGEAVADGTIDIIVSDHTPQDVEQKRQPFADAADGAIGLETMLAAGLRLVFAGTLTLPQLLRAMSFNPCRRLGLAGGRLAKGAPADLLLLDTDAPWIVDPSALHSRSRNTPFDEARMTGQVLKTFVAGKCVFEQNTE
jgi:dihydroorotase